MLGNSPSGSSQELLDEANEIIECFITWSYLLKSDERCKAPGVGFEPTRPKGSRAGLF